jgi:hypothetical protein
LPRRPGQEIALRDREIDGDDCSGVPMLAEANVGCSLGDVKLNAALDLHPRQMFALASRQPPSQGGVGRDRQHSENTARNEQESKSPGRVERTTNGSSRFWQRVGMHQNRLCGRTKKLTGRGVSTGTNKPRM